MHRIRTNSLVGLPPPWEDSERSSLFLAIVFRHWSLFFAIVYCTSSFQRQINNALLRYFASNWPSLAPWIYDYDRAFRVDVVGLRDGERGLCGWFGSLLVVGRLVACYDTVRCRVAVGLAMILYDRVWYRTYGTEYRPHRGRGSLFALRAECR